MSGRFDRRAKTQRRFTLAEKLAEVEYMTKKLRKKLAHIEREIVSRKRSYPNAVAKKKMSAKTAAARIDILRSIANDYREAMGAAADS